jgi:hypothetical protein
MLIIWKFRSIRLKVKTLFKFSRYLHKKTAISRVTFHFIIHNWKGLLAFLPNLWHLLNCRFLEGFWLSLSRLLNMLRNECKEDRWILAILIDCKLLPILKYSSRKPRDKLARWTHKFYDPKLLWVLTNYISKRILLV